jgi:ferredoxin
MTLQTAASRPRTKSFRNIIEIDRRLCDGCGACLTGCAEGALALVDGRVELVGEIYCDGLGACLAHCPSGALKVVQKLSEEFDEAAVQERLGGSAERPDREAGSAWLAAQGGCPGARATRLTSQAAPAAGQASGDSGQPRGPRRLSAGRDSVPAFPAWPIQLALIPPKAPFFDGPAMTVSADCPAFASADFHRLFLSRSAPLAVGCPKLDDSALQTAKLGVIFRDNPALREIDVPIMSVPCCRGLFKVAAAAADRSGRRDLRLRGWIFSPEGRLLEAGVPIAYEGADAAEAGGFDGPAGRAAPSGPPTGGV